VNKKILLVIAAIIALVFSLSACSNEEPLTAEGEKIFISSDKRYQVIAPADWQRDRNTIINGAVIAATKDGTGESQSLIVLSEKKTEDMTLDQFNSDILASVHAASADFSIIWQKEVELDGKRTIATKIQHKLNDKDTFSWIYAMDGGNFFLRINGFTYEPDVEENSLVIEKVIMSFEEVL
jgi:predicted small secreted protein